MTQKNIRISKAMIINFLSMFKQLPRPQTFPYRRFASGNKWRAFKIWEKSLSRLENACRGDRLDNTPTESKS